MKVFQKQLISVYKHFFQDINLEEYSESMFVDRINFLEGFEPQSPSQTELDRLSKAVLDAKAIEIVTNGLEDQYKKPETIKHQFLENGDKVAKNYLLELIVEAYYQSRDYEVIDFDAKHSSEDKSTPDFLIGDRNEFIETKRMTGGLRSVRSKFSEMRKKLSDWEDEYSDHEGHLILDLGTHTEDQPSKYEDFMETDFSR